MNQIPSEISTPSEWISNLSLILQQAQVRILNKQVSFDEAYNHFIKLLIEVKENKNNVWWIGNGGSAAMCSHLSQDLMNKLKIKSMLINDASLLTCMANDFGYENVYLKPLETLANSNDILIAISSSGNSKNILSCVNFAKKRNIKTITLSGFSNENLLWNTESDLAFYLNSKLYGLVEIGHEALLHAIIETIFINHKV